jgi:hypothetical protein
MVEATSEEVSREGVVVRWLREFLVVPRTADEVYKAAEVEGYSQSAIARASRKLDVKKMKRGMVGGWDWRLPDKTPAAPAKAEDAEGAEEVIFQSPTSSVSSASTAEFETRTERAAIMEFDGRLPHYEAERRASGPKPAAAYFRSLRSNGTRVTEVQSDSPNSVRR